MPNIKAGNNFKFTFFIAAISAGIIFMICSDGGSQAQADSSDFSSSLGVNNVAPSFTAAPHEDPTSDNTTPTDVGANLTIKATATDSNGNQWYLAVCKTNAITASNDAAPTCPGGEWDITGATNSGSEATASYTVQESDTSESYAWYGFACDKNAASPVCSAMSNSGTTGNNGSPFAANHRPTFTAISTNSPVNPGQSAAFSATTYGDTDTGGSQDTVSMYVCKSNDFTGTACGAGGTWCSGTEASSWLSGYNYRAKIPISHTDAGAQTNYTKQITIVKGAGTNSAGTIYLNNNSLNWPYDIRFTNSGGTQVSFYREEYDATDGTWHVELDSIASSGDTDFYVYYGKSSDTDASSGTNTFQFFEDGELGNLSRWSDSGDWAVTSNVKDSGNYSLYGHNLSSAYLQKTISLGSSFVHSRVRYASVSSSPYYCANRMLMAHDGAPIGAYYVGLTADGHLSYWYGPDQSNLPVDTTVSANTWYTLESAVDITNGLWRFWVNGSSKGSADIVDGNGNPVTPSETVSTIQIRGDSWNLSDMWVDNYWVRKYAYPEPAWAAPGSGETKLNCSSDNLANPLAHGSFSYYPYVIDSHNLAATGGKQGSAETFAVADTLPLVSGTPTLNNASAIDLTNEKSTTDIYVRGVVTDDNGCADISSAATDVWQTTLTGREGCPVDEEGLGYDYRAKIPVTYTTAGGQTNYTKQITIVKGSGTNSAGTIYLNDHALNWPYDVRFTKSDGATLLDFYREEYDATDGTWHVELDSIAASGDTDFYVYYGKSSDTDASSGPNSFLFFDDFELNNFSRWTTAGGEWSTQATTKYSGSYAGQCDYLWGGDTNALILNKSSISWGSVFVHSRVRSSSASEGQAAIFYAIKTSNAEEVVMNQGSFGYWSGVDLLALPTPTSYSADTWYLSETALDMSNSLYRFWINGSSKGTASLVQNSNISEIATAGFYMSATTFFVDDFWVRKYAYPEPAWASPGSEAGTSIVPGNYCYSGIACAYDATVDSCDGGNDKTAGFKCTVPFQYYANPTDANTPWAADSWTATLIPGDGQGANAAGEANTAAVEMNSFLALGLADGYSSIGYGNMSGNAHTDPLLEKIRIEATGNCSMDANISGTAMASGGNSIAASYQRYGLGTSAPAWSAGTALSGTPTAANLNVCKSGYTATPEFKPVWWGIEIPAGQILGYYTGTNTITAVKNAWSTSGDWCE